MGDVKRSRPNIHVVIPAYNEEKTIGKVVRGIKELDPRINVIVVDDGSDDATFKVAEEAGATVVRHPINLGQWAALRTGFTISLMNDADIIATLDGDGQHDPTDLHTVIQPILLGKADLVIGSRFMNDEKPKMPFYRYFGIKFFNSLLRLFTGVRLTDCTSGFKAYRASLILLLLSKLKENQYGALEVIVKARRLGARICERPIKSLAAVKTSKGKLKYGYNLLRSLLNALAG